MATKKLMDYLKPKQNPSESLKLAIKVKIPTISKHVS